MVAKAAPQGETSVSPEPFNTRMTPSGIEIGFWNEDKDAKIRRHYRVRDQNIGPWENVPESVSVTTAIDVLDKPALPWWGMGVGVEGTKALINMGLLKVGYMEFNQPVLMYEGEMGVWHAAGKDEIVELLIKCKMTTNHVRDAGGDRGQSVHDALEAWAKDGILPDPDIFPPHEQGYVVGLLRFLQDAALTPVDFEVMVGSVEHGYAGRYDLRAKAEQERQIVVHHTPKRGDQYGTLEVGLGLWDLKTSKDVYSSHCVQLEAYELAGIECGDGATDYRYVIHVDPNGRYKAVKSWAVPEDFLAVLATYNAFENMKARRKESK